MAVNARFPGSTHDAAIWAMSSERTKLERDYENGERNTWLLGDSGYPLEKWLITPFKNASTEQQRQFNHIQAQGRNPIERCNGVLKGTFRCLLGERKLRYEPTKVIKIVNVCCALFNMCLENNLELINVDEIPAEESVDDEELESEEEDDESANEIRQILLNTV